LTRTEACARRLRPLPIVARLRVVIALKVALQSQFHIVAPRACRRAGDARNLIMC